MGTPTTTSFYCDLDVVVEILTRLPIRSILRCACVCKQWYTLIKSAEFIQTHLSRAPFTLLIEYGNSSSLLENMFLTLSDNECSFFSERITPPLDNALIVGSINGLVCLDDTVYKTLIWNPLTKRYVNIPGESEDTWFTADYHVMGFGFDSISNDYKIVKMVFSRSSSRTICKHVGVYGLKENTWRMLAAKELRLWITTKALPCMNSCFINGLIYWSFMEETENCLKYFILSFDVHTECFSRINFPMSWADVSEFDDFDILEANGLLSIVHYRSRRVALTGDSARSSQIWVMKEYNVESSWTKICNIDLENIFVLKVIELKENGEILIVRRSDNELSDELSFYDPKTREIKRSGASFESYDPDRSIFYGGTYRESLLLLDKGGASVRCG